MLQNQAFIEMGNCIRGILGFSNRQLWFENFENGICIAASNREIAEAALSMAQKVYGYYAYALREREGLYFAFDCAHVEYGKEQFISRGLEKAWRGFVRMHELEQDFR